MSARVGPWNTTRSHQGWQLDRRPKSAGWTIGFPWTPSQLPSSRAPLLRTLGSRQPPAQPKDASGLDTLGQSPGQSRGRPTLCSPHGLLQAFSLVPSPCLSPAVLQSAEEAPQFHTSGTSHLALYAVEAMARGTPCLGARPCGAPLGWLFQRRPAQDPHPAPEPGTAALERSCPVPSTC